MKSFSKGKESLLALLLTIVLVFSTQMQIAAPAMSSEETASPGVVTVARPAGEETQPDAAVLSAAETETLTDSAPKNEPPVLDTALSPDEILPDADKDSVQELPEEGNTEKEGVTIIPVQLNNIIRDNLPSLISSKVYTFTVSDRGVLLYAFNHTGGAGDNCLWYITLYEEYSPDGSGKTVAYRELNRLVYSQTGSGVQSPVVGILPGNYRLAVECLSGYTAEKYDLGLGFSEADNYEVECNDTMTRYTHLPLGKTMNGSASSFTGGAPDSDWYMFEVSDTGYVVLYFEHEQDPEQTAGNVAWRIQIIDRDGNEYFYMNSTMEKTSINSGVMGLPPGCYFVLIESHVFSSVTYSVNVSFSEDRAVERELNETPETATPIAINTQTVGSLTARDIASDRDYYSFTMEQDGFIALNFMHEALSESRDGWNIAVVDENGRTAYRDVSDWSRATLQSPYIGLPAGRYYIRIDSDNLYHSSIVYRLILLSVQDGAWESEPNNTMEQADELLWEQALNGTLIETGVEYDQDYFVLTAETAGTLRVAFSHILSEEQNKEGWVISLLDSTGAELARATSDWNEEEISLTAEVEPGIYYVLVETGLYFNSSRYLLTASLTA